MNDPASKSVDPASATEPAPLPPTPVQPPAGARKKGVSLVVVLVGVLGAAVAVVVGLMSRSIAAPQASVATTTPVRSAPAPPVVADAVPPSRWDTGARWVSDRKSVAFELKSSNRVNVWMGQVQPLLVVRCVANRTEAFVYTETAARIEPGMEDRAVRVGFDAEPYVDERWLDSAEHKGLFAPNGETFTQRLLNASTLRFQFTPHNAERAEVQFDVAGLRDMLEPVQKKCGWDK
jgi:hypothetical protein